MTQNVSVDGSDAWSDWLMRGRNGGDSTQEAAIRDDVGRAVDRVLDAAKLAPGMVLADIGSGDGVLAFRAIERIGLSLQVLLADISSPLLRHAEHVAQRRGFAHQCRFHQGSADRLDSIMDASFDVLATRAALAYVHDKPAALREFYRVLKPGGRLSIAEPVMQDDAANAILMRRFVEAGLGSVDPLLGLLHRWKAAQYPDTPEGLAASPIANYSERDLLQWAGEGGFTNIHLELHIDVRRGRPRSWQVFLDTAPYPLAPTLRSVLSAHFSDEESRRLEQAIRPTVEAGPATEVDRVVYLCAEKPQSRLSLEA